MMMNCESLNNCRHWDAEIYGEYMEPNWSVVASMFTMAPVSVSNTDDNTDTDSIVQTQTHPKTQTREKTYDDEL